MTTRTEAWPDLAGRLTETGHVLPVRIYFEDTDFSGLVYHANFLKFMERGRSDMLRLMGVNHDELDEGVFGERLAFAVRRVEVDYLKPARIDDLVEVETVVEESAGVRLILLQSVRRGTDILVKGRITIVILNGEGRPRRLPDSMRERLSRPAA